MNQIEQAGKWLWDTLGLPGGGTPQKSSRTANLIDQWELVYWNSPTIWGTMFTIRGTYGHTQTCIDTALVTSINPEGRVECNDGCIYVLGAPNARMRAFCEATHISFALPIRADILQALLTPDVKAQLPTHLRASTLDLSLWTHATFETSLIRRDAIKLLKQEERGEPLTAKEQEFLRSVRTSDPIKGVGEWTYANGAWMYKKQLAYSETRKSV